jgi:hypothetical protein
MKGVRQGAQRAHSSADLDRRETQDGAGTKVQGSLCGRLEDYEAERGVVWVQLQGKVLRAREC